METPRTSSGKLCKKCLKKGKPCHLHTTVSGMASKARSKVSAASGRKSAKKSPTKKQKKRAVFADQFEHVPLPALQQILLNLDRKRLHEVCISSRQAAKVCKEPRFQQSYNARYPSLIVGNLRLIKTAGNGRLFKAPNGGLVAMNKAIFRDEADNTITIEKTESHLNNVSRYTLSFTTLNPDKESWLVLSLMYGDDMVLDFSVTVDAVMDDDTREAYIKKAGASDWDELTLVMVRKFLERTGKIKWYTTLEGIYPKFKHIKEFYSIFKTNIQKVGNSKKLWDTIITRPPKKSDSK